MTSIEVNPCSNIVQHLRAVRLGVQNLNLALVETWAAAGVNYMAQIEGKSPKPWSEILDSTILGEGNHD